MSDPNGLLSSDQANRRDKTTLPQELGRALAGDQITDHGGHIL